jgi:hypothetical protein
MNQNHIPKKAKKEYKCETCGKIIKKGDYYYFLRYYFYNHRICKTCAEGR